MFVVRLQAGLGLEDLQHQFLIRRPYFDGSGGIADPIVHSAIPMFGLHVLHFRLLGLEQAITFLAEMVITTLFIVLLPPIEAREVEVAIIAWPVGVGIILVLL